MSENTNFYPNQRRITNHKELDEKGQLLCPPGPKLIVSWREISNVALHTKNSNSVLLWQYFYKNADGYTVGFSPEEIEKTLGIGKKACRSAFNTLLQLGYFKLREGTKNHYDFIPHPRRL